MRIKEFFIKRYGPLREITYRFSNNFSIVFGENEDGKTLTIDALLKLLLGRGVRDFERIDRVPEQPEGYAVLEDNEGEELILPESGTLVKVAALTPSECRNIFVIRDSDLSISHQSVFFTDLTGRLVGLRAEEISRIKETLRDMGRMTPTGSFRDIKDEKLKTRAENAQNLIGTIASLIEEIKEIRYDQLEEEREVEGESLERVRENIEVLEEARKRERYEIGMAALRGLRVSLNEIRDLRVYTEEDEQTWRDCERDIQRWRGERGAFETEVQREEREFNTASERLEEKETQFRLLDGMRDRLDREVRQELIHCERRREEIAIKQRMNRFFVLTATTCAILFGISLIGLIVRPSYPYSVLTAFLLVSAIVLWVVNLQFLRQKASLAGALERIRGDLSSLGLGAESLEEMLANVQRFDMEYRQHAEQLDRIKRKREGLERRVRDLRDQTIPSITGKIEHAETLIGEIRRKGKEDTLESYSKKLRLRHEMDKSIGEQISVLRSHFGSPYEALEQDILHWEKQIETLAGYQDKAKDIEYSESAVLKLQRERQQIEEHLREIDGRISVFEKKNVEIERKVNETLRPEGEYLHCNTSVDLKAVAGKLQVFLEENEQTKENASKAIRIFEEIEREEREKVCALFGPESPVSDYFARVTDGLYRDVTFDQNGGEIQVKRRDGVMIGSDKLSGGAYDQLYLSVRLALGEKLLKGKKGFFILDDPLIKADWHRLRRQVKMLKRISDGGWQVIYFSAKEEIKEAFKQAVKRGSVDQIEITPLFV